MFENWGRAMGRLSMPAYQKAKWAWQSLAGSEEDRLKAERELGGTLALKIRASSTAPAAAADFELVRRIGDALAARLKNRQIRFRIDAIQLPEPSALALPGGYIFISVSLLDLCQRYEDEIAFVLGHEMAHVIRGHATDHYLQESFMKALASRLGRATPLGGLVKDTTLQLLSSAYSQECEFEADEFGSRLAQAAGHHPLASIRLLERLQHLHGDQTPLGQYFSSHPPPAERTARLRRVWSSRLREASHEAQTDCHRPNAATGAPTARGISSRR
ncbi:MAG TPA: M48 family metallopeptidase [Verrucomicrobiota bacterium]|jgi:predicted Zn-dependent protease|nr:M48 family metallopeptidase [Verrucomicrobiota bacterium]